MSQSLLAAALFVLSLAVAAPAQQDLEARLDAVKEFAKYMKKAKEESVQIEAVMTLKGNECVPAAQELVKLLKNTPVAVQQAALDVLSTYTEQATFQAWIDELPKLKDSEQAAILIRVLGRAKVKQAAPVIEAVATDAKATSTVKFEAARAIQNIGATVAAALVGKLLVDPDALVRMAGADLVAAQKLKEHGKAVTALLSDSEWQVQSAAIGAVGKVRPQEAVQPLIDLLRKSGRLKTECAEALFQVTGFEFGIDAERWQSQWNSLLTMKGYRIPTDEELAKKAESRKKADALYGKTPGLVNKFVGIETTSTNVLFIIDISGSMDDLVVEVEKFQGYKDRKRFTIVQTELINTIDTLTNETNFDILAFATDLHPWKKRLVPANIVNRDAAKAFVRGLQPLGGTESQDLAAAGLGGSANLEAGKTNTLKALLYAFGVDPEKPSKGPVTAIDKTNFKSPLDTVYFLSDGRPSVGKLIEANEIRKEVRRYNEIFRIVLHTIAIGDFQKEFLKQLAEENGGVYVDLGR
jgi:HEAT repeat protein